MESLKEQLNNSNCDTIECYAIITANFINEKQNKVYKHVKKHAGKYAFGTAALGATAYGIAKGMEKGRK